MAVLLGAECASCKRQSSDISRATRAYNMLISSQQISGTYSKMNYTNYYVGIDVTLPVLASGSSMPLLCCLQLLVLTVPHHG